jgi:hypothetical protein
VRFELLFFQNNPVRSLTVTTLIVGKLIPVFDFSIGRAIGINCAIGDDA